MRVIEAIARNLYDCGLRHCFGLIGEDVGELLDELRRVGVAYYSARHESAAVAMADGYARASGTVGVAVVSKGPGLLNAMNALETANKGGSSVLVIVGDSPPDQSAVVRGRKGKYIDQTAILTAAGELMLEGGLPAATMEAIATRARLPSAEVAALLHGPPPATDQALVTLAAELDTLERKLRQS